MWETTAVTIIFLVGVALVVLLWITWRFKPAQIDIRRIGAESGLIDDAVPNADAYSIRLFNDDLTPMDFVVETLQTNLGLSRDHSVYLMLRVHQRGAVDVGRMHVDKASGVANAILARSREHKHPFRCEAVRHEPASGID